MYNFFLKNLKQKSQFLNKNECHATSSSYILRLLLLVVTLSLIEARSKNSSWKLKNFYGWPDFNSLVLFHF